MTMWDVIREKRFKRMQMALEVLRDGKILILRHRELKDREAVARRRLRDGKIRYRLFYVTPIRMLAHEAVVDEAEVAEMIMEYGWEPSVGRMSDYRK